MSHFILFMFTFRCNCFYLLSLSEAIPSQRKGRTGYFLMALFLSFWSFKKNSENLLTSEKLQSRVMGMLVIAVLFVQMALGSITATVSLPLPY